MQASFSPSLKSALFYMVIIFALNVNIFANNSSHSTPLSKLKNYPITKFTVGKEGEANFPSIQDAINAAIKSSGGSIFVQPGKYIEDLDFSYANSINITLTGAVAIGDEGQCEIIGTHTPPLQGSLALRNFKLSAEKAIFLSLSSGNAHLVIMDALLNVKDGYSFNLPNWHGIFELFDVNRGKYDDGGIINRSGSSLFLYNAGLGSGKKHRMILSGQAIILGAGIGCSLEIVGSGNIKIDNSTLEGELFIQDSSIVQISNSHLISLKTTVITQNSNKTTIISNTVIDGPKNLSITGYGKINLSSVTLSHSPQISKNITIIRSNIFSTGNIETNSISLSEGKNDSQLGSTQLSEGMVFIPLKNISSNSRVFLSIQSPSSNLGIPFLGKISPQKGFYIKSTNKLDNSHISWLVIQPIKD